MSTLLDLIAQQFPDGPPAPGVQIEVEDSDGRRHTITFGEVEPSTTDPNRALVKAADGGDRDE